MPTYRALNTVDRGSDLSHKNQLYHRLRTAPVKEELAEYNSQSHPLPVAKGQTPRLGSGSHRLAASYDATKPFQILYSHIRGDDLPEETCILQTDPRPIDSNNPSIHVKSHIHDRHQYKTS
jgi:hypothetical protein